MRARSDAERAVRELDRYWPRAAEAILNVKVPEVAKPDPEPLPPPMATVGLPSWANDAGVDGGLLVPSYAIAPGADPEWRRTDWFSTVLWYLDGAGERTYERAHGPIHSYAFRLPGWDSRIWQRAWVNRIALFLRRWAARELGRHETDVFGPLPSTDIVLTHDVDAVRKTLPIRLKQSAFRCFNAVRSSLRGQGRQAVGKMGAAVRFLLSSEAYLLLDKVAAMEEACDLRSHFLFYGAAGARTSPRRWLLDPSYDIQQPALVALVRSLRQRGFSIGLHQSFDAWNDPHAMRQQKERVELAAGAEISACRQHWLRFSWERTWAAQETAGLGVDMTLGFNDRPGFRNGAALGVQPRSPDTGTTMRLRALPLVLMDSHLYDYARLSSPERLRTMSYWFEEIREVRGTASVLWHPHTLASDYGWDRGFRELLDLVSNRP